MLEFFIDGQRAHPEFNALGDPYITVIPESSEGAYRFGQDKTNGIFWVGSLDEIAIYNYDLDDPNGDGDTADSVLPAHAAAMTSNSQIAFLGFGIPDTQGTMDGILGPAAGVTIKIKVGATANSVTVNGEPVTPVNGMVELLLTDLTPGDHTFTVNVDGEERTAMITLLPEFGITDYMIDPEGPATFTAENAVPGATYDLEYSENLVDWNLVISTTAPASTIIQADDTVGPQGATRFFYRFIEFE